MVNKVTDVNKLREENVQLQSCIELLERVVESNTKTIASLESDMVALKGALEMGIPIDNKPREVIDRLHTLGNTISSIKKDLEQYSVNVSNEIDNV